MNNFYSNKLISKFGKENLNLLAMDTNSLMLEIQNKDPSEFMKNKVLFDLSNNEKNHELNDTTKKMLLVYLKMKVQIIKSLSLQENTLSYIPMFHMKINHIQMQREKKIVKEQELEHNNYKTCLNKCK